MGNCVSYLVIFTFRLLWKAKMRIRRNFEQTKVYFCTLFICQQTHFLLSEYSFEWVVLKFVTQIGSRKDVNKRISLPFVLIFKTTIDPKSTEKCLCLEIYVMQYEKGYRTLKNLTWLKSNFGKQNKFIIQQSTSFSFVFALKLHFISIF